MRWEGRRRAVRTERQSVLAAPAGACGRKMAELRALVAVKRVIDFAVKVTGTPSHLPGPFGRVLLGPRARKCLGVFSYLRFLPLLPQTSVTPEGKVQGPSLVSDPSSLEPDPSGVTTPFPFPQFSTHCLDNCVQGELWSLFLTCWRCHGPCLTYGEIEAQRGH